MNCKKRRIIWKLCKPRVNWCLCGEKDKLEAVCKTTCGLVSARREGSTRSSAWHTACRQKTIKQGPLWVYKTMQLCVFTDASNGQLEAVHNTVCEQNNLPREWSSRSSVQNRTTARVDWCLQEVKSQVEAASETTCGQMMRAKFQPETIFLHFSWKTWHSTKEKIYINSVCVCFSRQSNISNTQVPVCQFSFADKGPTPCQLFTVRSNWPSSLVNLYVSCILLFTILRNAHAPWMALHRTGPDVQCVQFCNENRIGDDPTPVQRTVDKSTFVWGGTQWVVFGVYKSLLC